MLVLLDAIKAAHARARARGSGDVLKHLDSPRFRNGHYGTVRYPQKFDKGEFNAGDWYKNSRYSTEPGNLQKSFVKLIKELVETDESDDNVDEKFVWQWWFAEDD